MNKKAFVLADFIYGISLLIVAIVLAIFIGNMTTKFKNSLEKNNIIKEFSEFGVIQFLYPPSNYYINTKSFDLKLFSLKDLKIKYKVFFIDNYSVTYCYQDVYGLKKGLNIIPMDLSSCINSSSGIIRISALYDDALLFTYDIKYDNKTVDLEFLNMPLRNYVAVGSDVIEGLPNVYYSTIAKNVRIEMASPYYYVEDLLSLSPGNRKTFDASKFIYSNLTFNINGYSTNIYSIYLNNYYVGSAATGNKLETIYKNDYFVKSLDIYEGNYKLGHIENTKLTVTDNSYDITIKNIEVCLVDADNTSIKLPGFVFVRNTKKIYYTDHGDKKSCVYVPLAFTPDLTQHVLDAYDLTERKHGDAIVTSNTESPVIIELQ